MGVITYPCPNLIYVSKSGSGAVVLKCFVNWEGITILQALSRQDNPCTLRWHHNGHDSVSNHQPYDFLLNCLFRRWSKKTSKLRVSGLCAGNSPGTGEFPAQRASNAENISIWWRHHDAWWRGNGRWMQTRQGTPTSNMHMNKNFQSNTFHKF